MAKKTPTRRRKFRRYIRGNIDLNGNLGTLAPTTAILLIPADVVEERTLISSVINSFSLSGFTKGDNIGPLSIGIAHSDYSLAEIEAWIEQSTGWAEGDKVSQEVAKRLIRRIGVFDNPIDVGDSVSLNDGKPIKMKLNWILTTGQNVKYFIYNEGSAALATTDPNCHISGHANLWPR